MVRPVEVTPEEKKRALIAGAEGLRQKLWGSTGTVVSRVEVKPESRVQGGQDVTIHCGLVSRGRPHWHLLTEGLGTRGYELSLRVQKEKDEFGPPAWASALLSTLISRANAGQLSADTNQVMVLAQGVAPGTDSELFGVIFTPDPEAPGTDAMSSAE